MKTVFYILLIIILSFSFSCDDKKISVNSIYDVNNSHISSTISLNNKKIEENNNSEQIIDQKIRKKSQEAYDYCKENDLNTNYCFLINMGEASGKNRFYLWDFKKDTIVMQSLCAHGIGRGSTEEKPVFSNEDGSLCTSLGKYKVGIRSYSQYGINIHYKLHGLEKSNNNAYKRIIVLHSSPLPEKEIYPNSLQLGWSHGCPVIDNSSMKKVDELLKNEKKPPLLWIYN